VIYIYLIKTSKSSYAGMFTNNLPSISYKQSIVVLENIEDLRSLQTKHIAVSTNVSNYLSVRSS